MSTADSDPASRFARMYEANYGHVHAYAARRVGHEAADDIAAETFTVAWRRADAIPDPPLPWLYGVARNIVLRHYSADARQEAVRRALAAEPRAVEDAPRGDAALWDAWRQLSHADQEVLALIAWEELPVREAARSLGCSAPVFSVRLHRARKRLERMLEHPAAVAAAIPNLSESA